MDPKQKPKDDDEKPPLTEEQREEIQSIVNGALGDFRKRTEKAMTDVVTKALEPLTKQLETLKAPPEEEKPGKGAKGEDSPEYKALLKRVEAAEKKQAEADARAKAEAEARRRDLTDSTLRAAFEGVNVRKEALDVLVAAAEKRGLLRYDDEGKPSVVVKRSRAKGAEPEELSFDDLKRGVEDWAKTPEAAVFIKAPDGVKKAPTPTGQRQPGEMPRYTKEADTEEQKVDRVLEIMNSSAGG